VFEAHGDFEPALLGAVGSNGADGEGGGDPETPGSRGCRGKKEHKREDYLLPIPLEKVTTQPLQVLQTASYFCLGRLILLYLTTPLNRPYPLRSLSYQPQQILFSFPPPLESHHISTQSKLNSTTANMTMTIAVCRVCERQIEPIAHLAHKRLRGQDDRKYYYFNINADPEVGGGLFGQAWRRLVRDGWKSRNGILKCPCY
jgi:hypothetical protein